MKKVLASICLLGVMSCTDGQSGGVGMWEGAAPASDASLQDKALYLSSQGQDPAVQFELGLVEALRGIEVIYQHRYEHYSGQLPIIPGGRRGLRVNENAKFDPAFIENGLLAALEHFAKAEKALKTISGKEFSYVINPNDIWLDIDKNGERHADEAFLLQLAALMGGRGGLSRRSNLPEDIEIRFDTADADWALAYVHNLSALSEFVIALDTTSAIKEAVDGRQALLGDSSGGSALGVDREIDTIAALIFAYEGKPDVARMRRAREHLLDMIGANRRFWKNLENETDNDREWIPNSEQESAFGLEVSEELAQSWQDILTDFEDVMEGRKLVPFWRLGRGNVTRGINMKRLMMDPPDTDIIRMIHGGTLAPYIEEGDVIEMGSWRRFRRLTGRQNSLFALWFN